MTKINFLNGLLPTGGRLIPLTQGQVAIIDDEDFEEINKYKWYANFDQRGNRYYARRNVPIGPRQQKAEMMHWAVLKHTDKSKHVDHINHNTLDNRKENLRVVSARENGSNRKKKNPYGPGIRRRKDRKNQYEAYATINRKHVYIGAFSNPEIARATREVYLNETTTEA